MEDPKKAIKTTKCLKCGKEVPQTSFCINCGNKLDIVIPKESEKHFSKIICPSCKQSVPITDYCILCGKKIKSSPLSETTHTDESEISSNLLTCPLCRENVPFDHNFCHLCGGRIKKEETDQIQSLICNRCWKPNPPNTEYCIHCGTVSLGRHTFKAKLLEKPFEGFQLDHDQFFQPSTVPLSALRQRTSKNFPIRSTIMHSAYFGVKIQKSKQNIISRNFGAFNRENLLNYTGTFFLLLIIYIYWYFSRYIELTDEMNLITEGISMFSAIILLTFLIMVPIWLSTFFVYRNTGYRLHYKLDLTRVFFTIIFNGLWILLPQGFGPILLRMGEFKDLDQRAISQKSFIKGIVWGSIITVFLSVILGLLTVTIVGVPGMFAGFLFKDHPLKGHILATYIGATWISIILLLPLGEYFDRVIKQWNLVGYILLLIIGFLLLSHSFNLISFLTQTIKTGT
ncbi:MAG: zinc ribbon domain-containing protein [Candidatus Hermodarchaeota archaeon]